MTFKLFKTAFTALRVNLLRSILTMLGIIIGVSAVIIMVALGEGAQQKVDAQIKSLGGNIYYLHGMSRRNAGANTGTGTVRRINEDQANLIEKELDSVEAVAPVDSINAQVIYGNLNWSTRINGSDNRYLTARNWNIASGREFSQQETRSGGKVAIIGDTVARELFGNDDPVGENIRINKFNVKVIGTLKPKGQDTRGEDQDDILIMPLKTVRSRLTGVSKSNPKRIRVMFIKAYDGEDPDKVEGDIRNLMRQKMNVKADQEDPFRLRNLSQMVATRAETAAIFNSLLAGVASVSLIVGGIGIMNIMLVSVTERTREIGLRMAVGASPKNIMNQFLVEAITLCAMGGAIGISIAAIATYIMTNTFNTAAVIQFDVVLISFGFSAMIGIFFGYYPALKASKLEPIDALRYE